MGQHVDWVTVCPEVELGLDVPRPTLRLERQEDGIHLMMPSAHTDHTATMRHYVERRIQELARLDLSGFIVKSHSPSCGMEGVTVYDEKGVAFGDGRGLFTAALLESHPSLPVAEEGHLDSPDRQESFLERVFAYRRLRALFKRRWKLRDLVAFHTAHRLQLWVHTPSRYERLEAMLAQASGEFSDELQDQYTVEFMQGLSVPAPKCSHLQVLRRILEYIEIRIGASAKERLLVAIEDYSRGFAPLTCPIRLLRCQIELHGDAHLLAQTYLYPHPEEWFLRNRIRGSQGKQARGIEEGSQAANRPRGAGNHQDR